MLSQLIPKKEAKKEPEKKTISVADNSYLSSIILYAVCTVLCVVMPATLNSLWPFVIVLVGTPAMTYGLNPLLTTIMPMQYTSLNRVALAAGLLDAMIYVGSSFSGTFAGFLSDRFGWSAVFVSWAVLSLIGTLMLAAAQRVSRDRNK